MDIKTFINTYREELEQLLLTLARIPAPSGKEEKRAEFCLNWLHAHGANEAYIDQAGNVVYLYQKKGNDADTEAQEIIEHTADIPLVVFDAHMDVVFPDETELPLYEEDGKIYCPGVGDDTANLAVLLMTAAYAAKYQPDTGSYGLLFLCSVGEEGLGNLKGVREITESFGDRMEAFYSFDLHLDAYTCRAVGSLRYRISVETKGGHSYGDFGNTNANAALAALICDLYEIQVPKRGKTTYNVGMISGGTSVNTIAQQAEMLYEIRSDDHEDLMEIKLRFEEVLAEYQDRYPDVQIKTEKIGERPCEKNVDSEKRNWLFAQTERILEGVTGKVPQPIPCSTNCNIPLSLGIPSVCVGMCEGTGAHTREEYVVKTSLVKGMEAALKYLDEVKGIYGIIRPIHPSVSA